MHVQVKQLPDSLRDALRAVGYARADIGLRAKASTTLNDYGADGRQAFVVVVNLKTREYKISRGSWGGPNAYCLNNAVDLDQTEYPIPLDGAVIKGSRGNSVYATIYVHPDALAPLLPAPSSDVSDKEKAILYAYNSLKSGPYRQEELRRVDASQSDVDALIAKGLLKRNAAGSVSITTDGKNASGRGY